MGLNSLHRRGRGLIRHINPPPLLKTRTHPCDEKVDDVDLPSGVEILSVPSKLPLNPSQLIDLSLANLRNPLYDRPTAIREAKVLLRSLANLKKRRYEYLDLWHELHRLGVLG